MKIGIIKEGKVPPDNRTPLTPRQCMEMLEKNENIEIEVQWSAIRCFPDEDYLNFEIPVKEYIDDCDLMLGIKEVPVDMLVPEKTYMFFSHTIKKQPYNRKLLQTVLENNIRLIDYELLTEEKGRRMIGFGRWAGIVGAHYALLMLGERTQEYEVKQARNCINLQELTDQYDIIQFPQAKIVITGGGRVAQGAIELMHYAGIEEVSPEDFLANEFEDAVFTILHSDRLFINKNTNNFNKEEFYSHPENYKSNFKKYIEKTDVLINCIYWDPKAPALFDEADTKTGEFRMRIISDISCDVNGSIPITHKVTSIEDPVFGYHRGTGKIGQPYLEDTIDVMAVPNLPNELPRDASRDFGVVMMEKVLPLYLTDPENALFERATIARNGKLTKRYDYLQDYVENKE
jgi:alanine dehydrogenase